MKKSYNCVDLAKLIGSFMLLTMHLSAFNDFGFAATMHELLSRWCVPFFFLTSSFFLFSKSENGNISRSVLYSYLRRIGQLYLMWFIINLPFVIYRRLYEQDILQIKTWLYFIKNSLLSSSFTGSWYLVSCIFSAWFVQLLSKKMTTKAILAISFALYLPCLFTSMYGGLLPSNIVSKLAFLCFPLNLFNGSIFFALGKYIVERQSALLSKFGKIRSLMLTVVFFLIYLLEYFVAKKLGYYRSTDVAFGLIPTAFFLFLFIIQQSIELKNPLAIRKASTIIFCCQGNILLIKGILKYYIGIESSIILYSICCCFVLGIVFAVLYLQKHSSWKWVRHLT